MSLVPNCIMREIWRNRNKGRFERDASQAAQIIRNVDAAITCITVIPDAFSLKISFVPCVKHMHLNLRLWMLLKLF